MCTSCSPTRINGHLCHELGCPSAWKDYSRKCFECGFDFQPEEQHQRLCNDCLNPADVFEEIEAGIGAGDEEGEE